ncbi:hypothetical protein BD311DRAFT_548999 [Dichomitus squalens]|uniref:Uncharacterized protein n=1 Tax=Dichomitus squalens TaxID=114155 RepID=A0A4Q9N0M2_9APHY|nr:hypothetical protein BD311DRAFT_548999 [Dichomitus squalens]
MPSHNGITTEIGTCRACLSWILYLSWPSEVRICNRCQGGRSGSIAVDAQAVVYRVHTSRKDRSSSGSFRRSVFSYLAVAVNLGKFGALLVLAKRASSGAQQDGVMLVRPADLAAVSHVRQAYYSCPLLVATRWGDSHKCTRRRAHTNAAAPGIDLVGRSSGYYDRPRA